MVAERRQSAGRAPRADRAETGARARLCATWSRPAVRHLVILAGYLAAGIAVTWPRTAYLVQGRLPNYGDVVSYVWDLWWVAHQVAHLGNPFFTSHMAAPAGVQLGFDTLIPLLGVVMTPVTLAFGPSASLSLLTIAVPGLACYAMYRVGRLWLRTEAGAIAAGACFGLSSMLDWQDWYHLQISAGVVFLPVTLEAAVRLRRRPGPRQGLILGLVLGAAVLVNQETAVMAGILAALALVPWLLRAPAPGPARLGALALGALAAAAVASPQLIAMAQQAASGGAVVSPHLLALSDAGYGTSLGRLFAPSPRVASFGLPPPSSLGPAGEGMPGFGVLITVLALGGLAASWRRHSAWLLAGLWLGGAALALGVSLWVGWHQYLPLRGTADGVPVSDLMPYTWLIRIPGLAAFRDAARLALLGLVGAALLAGSAVDWLRGHARLLIVGVAVLGVLEAGWPGRPGPGPMPTTRPALDRPIAADRSDSVVLDIPFGLRGGPPLYGSHLNNASLLIATADGHPRAVSYTAREPAPVIASIAGHPFFAQLVRAQDGDQIPAPRLAAARRDLRGLGIGWAIVWQPNDRAAIRYLTAAGFRFACRADGAVVYRLAAATGPAG